MLLPHCAQVPCSEQQNLVKNRVETGAWIAWIMAEIKPYTFEPMRDSSELEEDDAHEKQDERRRGIHRGVYASVVQTGKGNKRKNVYAVRRSRKP